MISPAVRTPSSLRSPLPIPQRLTAGTYLTDEVDLFRCVSVGPPDAAGATALLEDCRTLDLIVFPLDDLWRHELRLVEPHG
jgi:hypothetical protein